MAFAFNRLGSKVFLFERGPRVLSKEDPDVSALMEKIFSREGINVLTNAEITRIEKKGSKKIIHYKHKNKNKKVAGDEILQAVGRSPNVEGLGLDRIGVEQDKRGFIKVNNKMQTSVKNVYAIGDVKGRYLFTHMAAYEAGIALANALFLPVMKADYSVVPWTTYTDPEVAHVGLSEKEALEKHPDAIVIKEPFKDVDRAQTDNATTGFLKVITDKKGKLLSVTIVGSNAGELLAEFTLAMRKKLTLKDVFQTIHVYPTLSTIAAKAGGKYYETKLTGNIKNWLQRIFGFGKK